MKARADAPVPPRHTPADDDAGEQTAPQSGPPTPREWIGDRPFPWPPFSTLADGDTVVACFTVLDLGVGRTREDIPFLRLQLADCYGTVETRLWDDIDAALTMLHAGLYVGVRGRIEPYHDERQLHIEQIAALHVDLDDLVLFLPRSARPADVMTAELEAMIGSIADEPLRRLLAGLLGADTETGRGFRLAPAAKHHHHAYLGGLLEHTLSVARVCDLLAAHYGARIDRDLLLTGALLHDIGKIREIGARAGFPYTDEGKLIGHILLGAQMVAEAGAAIAGLHPNRLLLVQHLIASHQGRYEWQSPREPRTIEAVVLHYADDLDAKLHQANTLLSAVELGWTAYDRSFGRDFLRHRSADDEASAAARGALDDAPMPAAGSGPRKAQPPLDTLDLFGS